MKQKTKKTIASKLNLFIACSMLTLGACGSFGNKIEAKRMQCLKEFLEINVTAKGSVEACEWVMGRRS